MVKPSNLIRSFILRNVAAHPTDIAKHTSTTLGMSRMDVQRHIVALRKEGLLKKPSGETRSRLVLAIIAQQMGEVEITSETEDDAVWNSTIRPAMVDVPENIISICQYGFTEMFNNVIDHSESKKCLYYFSQTPINLQLMIRDYGVGIFAKIADHFGLPSRRHALLELSKGKLTSFPERHSGEGIFFTSRMFDRFVIHSGDLFYTRKREESSEWLIEVDEPQQHQDGTVVQMTIALNATREAKDVFVDHIDDEDGFTRTHVPMTLAKHAEGGFVSRSQAKRVLARFDKFSEVFLDFKNVETVGQAFADEIFRVFAREHPDTNIVYINANEDVERMIRHAKRNAASL